MISLSHVAKAYGANELFHDVTFQLVPGRRVALVGGNGVGKTTLLEIVVGLEDADSGQVTRHGGTTIGYLPQDVTDDVTGTVLEHVLAGAGEVQEVGDRLSEVEAALERDEATGVEHQQLIEEHGRLSDRFTALGGWGLEAEAHRVLAGLGFGPKDGDRPVSELSGGWRVRTALARLLLAKPDVLVLDEPTNHLDLASMSWLEALLSGYEGAILFVSHDRGFIDGVAERIVEVAAGTAHEYVTPPGKELGPFDQFRQQREQRLAQLAQLQAQQQKEIEEVEEFIERFRYKASKARQVQSRVKQLEKMDTIELPEDRRVVPRFSFPEPPRSPRVVMELEGVSKGFPGREVLRDVSFVVERGWKIAVVGPNGHGKSTLLKLITGDLTPDTGTVKVSPSISWRLFGQHQVDAAAEYGLKTDRSVLQEFATALTNEHRNLNARSLLGGFGFPGDLAERQVGVCSGGEQTRLALAKLLVSPINLLLLDEPTNHLDMASSDVLEDAIAQWPGTVMLVSHDRHLIDAVATHVIEVVDGDAVLREGTFDDFDFEWITGRRQDPRSAIGTGKGAGPAQPKDPHGPESKAGARRARALRREEANERKKLQKTIRDLQKAIGPIETALMAAEDQVAELTRQLGEPGAYDDQAAAAKLAERHGRAKDQAAKLGDTWEQLAEALETAEGRLEAFDAG